MQNGCLRSGRLREVVALRELTVRILSGVSESLVAVFSFFAAEFASAIPLDDQTSQTRCHIKSSPCSFIKKIST